MNPLQPIPQHIAIIMDGNGRWAKQRGFDRLSGHSEGGKAADRTIRACLDHGVKHLTLFAFSKENWLRPQSEVDGLMKLLTRYLKKEGKKQQQLNIGLNVIGDTAELSDTVRTQIERTKALHPPEPDMQVHLALNYSGKWDMAQAAESLRLDDQAITVERIADRLTTANIPEPDLLIRTGGEHRISNFLLWQLAYTELVFLDLLWPDFSELALQQALMAYQKRERRFGLISEQLKTNA